MVAHYWLPLCMTRTASAAHICRMPLNLAPAAASLLLWKIRFLLQGHVDMRVQTNCDNMAMSLRRLRPMGRNQMV
jgi:hypothetical protein